MNAADMILFYEPKDRLRLTVDNELSYHTVRPAWSAPLSQPGKFLALLNGKGEEIVTLPDPDELPFESLTVVKEELRRRYLTATVKEILHAKFEYGATYWSVDTDRGQRDFVTQHLQENAIWLSDTHLLLLDVDGNRFEIEDTTAMNAKSRAYISAIL
jgi:Domain of unknown function (DUF1854).